MKKWFLLFLLITLPAFAAQDIYQFNNGKDQERFSHLTSQLRCLVCQNQTIADSNAGLANDLRDQIYQKIQHGESNQQILDYLLARYGNFVLYNPPFVVSTWMLWLGPFMVLFGGLVYLMFYLKKRVS